MKHWHFLGPFNTHGLTVIPAWIGKHMPREMWYEITYPFPNFNGCAVEVGNDKWFHPTLFDGCNWLTMLRLKIIHFSERGPWCKLQPAWHNKRKYWGLYFNLPINNAHHPVIHLYITCIISWCWSNYMECLRMRKRINRMSSYGSTTAHELLPVLLAEENVYRDFRLQIHCS